MVLLQDAILMTFKDKKFNKNNDLASKKEVLHKNIDYGFYPGDLR